MRFAFFYHSLFSDWNHGNAHFLRGIVAELQQRGHQVQVYEPQDGWSLQNLLASHGEEPIAEFRCAYPTLRSTLYDSHSLNLDEELDGVDVVLVHEWNDPDIVSRIGRHRASGGEYVLLFHDTHHRSVTAPQEMERYDLGQYDGALVFGDVIGEIYRQKNWADRVWTWHEAADTRIFFPPQPEGVNGARIDPTANGNAAPHPARGPQLSKDLIWIGNWGDGERAQEMSSFLIEPARNLALSGNVHGVRYPPAALDALGRTRLTYRGWLANHDVPAAFARHRATLHVPRRPYVESLPGIPTIRVFEALACGIPLVCAPWEDREGLFRPGRDYLVAPDGARMERHLRAVLDDPDLAASLARSGLETIRARHTCRHRVDELLEIVAAVSGRPLEPAHRTAPGGEPSVKEATR